VPDSPFYEHNAYDIEDLQHCIEDGQYGRILALKDHTIIKVSDRVAEAFKLSTKSINGRALRRSARWKGGANQIIMHSFYIFDHEAPKGIQYPMQSPEQPKYLVLPLHVQRKSFISTIYVPFPILDYSAIMNPSANVLTRIIACGILIPTAATAPFVFAVPLLAVVAVLLAADMVLVIMPIEVALGAIEPLEPSAAMPGARFWVALWAIIL
jgi:hypothetical protein